MKSPRELLINLLEYIEEQTKSIDPKAFRLSTHKGYLRRHTDLVNLPGLEFDIRTDDDHIWMRLARLEAFLPPVAVSPYKNIFKVSDDPSSAQPSIDESKLIAWMTQHELRPIQQGSEIVDEKSQLEILRKKVNSALQEYIPLWKSWAIGERPRRTAISLYGDVFSLKHQMEAEETVKPIELIWGIGVATWQIPCDQGVVDFEYPLLSQSVEISIDEKTMALEIRPRNIEVRVELEAFVGCSVRGATEIERTIKEQIQRNKENPATPFDPASYTDVLKLAASNLDSQGAFEELLSTGGLPPTPSDNLIVTDTWVLFSRPRTTHYLTEDLKRLKQKLSDDCVIPAGPLALVTAASDQVIKYSDTFFRGLSGRGMGSGKPKELYFPLPYNDEQVTIIKRLENSAGVTVQGPPGTGKTHTIANVICHYLATGKRILVTSKGEPALKVLQSKIPEEVRALTVALMSSDREGVRQFQASIEKIQHQVSQLNPDEVGQEITRLEGSIDRAHSELILIDRRIDEIAMSQLSDIEIDGEQMRAQKMADLVISGNDVHAWFDDLIPLSGTPPLTEEESGLLREARRNVNHDLPYVNAQLPVIDSLPSAKDFSALHEILSSMRKIEAEIEQGNLLELKSSAIEVVIAARELFDLTNQALTLIEGLEANVDNWPIELRKKCSQSAFIAERQALESLFAETDLLIAARAEFLKRPVNFPHEGLSNIKTREAVARAVENGKPFGLISIGAGLSKEHIASIRISGLPPVSCEDWSYVQRYIDLHEQVLTFIVRWNQFADDLSIPKLEGGVADLRRIENIAVLARHAHKLATELDPLISEKADAVFRRPPISHLTGNSSELLAIRAQLERHITKAELATAANQLSSLQVSLAGKTGKITVVLQQVIEQYLGKPSISSERITAKYSSLISELQRVLLLSNYFSLIKEFSTRFRNAGALKFASRICSLPVNISGEDTVFPTTWRQAWNWARIKTHLDSIEARSDLIALAARRRTIETGLSRLYTEMVAKAAWLATKQNASPKILQALAGYATAIRRIGQGTGTNASRYRKDAQQAMLDAVGAVPCWIMSHSRISEAMPPDIGAFDLVIVDEASQSDLWALPAILRAKKILIVGDDKQVSPDGGFISSQWIQELKDRFLAEQPYGVEMTPEKSLYDLGARLFAAEQVMLREHFRCVPAIISYSNRVFYKDGIQPLRIPKASERIDPPLVDIYVQSGFRDKSREINNDEATAIADEISFILKNEAFAKKSIGVVSLLGMDQAKHIDTVVRKRCSHNELMIRHFECGDARTFQGSERDIIFLSLVADKNSCKALSGNAFDQRFNVAASRARDRMYLVRSVKDSDLSDKDLRLTLLNHFNNPLVTDKEETGVLIDLCESGFERDFFSKLVSLGYRVIPQVKAGAYRIDMVVEGAGDNRLAIELDGDEYHGPDRWPHDMNRQRVLERAGWLFWRCFASTWSLRKSDVLSELIERLTAMGIEPIGSLEYAPSLVEKRVWSPPELTDELAIFQEEKLIEPTDAAN